MSKAPIMGLYAKNGVRRYFVRHFLACYMCQCRPLPRVTVDISEAKKEKGSLKIETFFRVCFRECQVARGEKLSRFRHKLVSCNDFIRTQAPSPMGYRN